MAKDNLTVSGLKHETPGFTYHLSYPALWMVTVPNDQLVFSTGRKHFTINWNIYLQGSRSTPPPALAFNTNKSKQPIVFLKSVSLTRSTWNDPNANPKEKILTSTSKQRLSQRVKWISLSGRVDCTMSVKHLHKFDLPGIWVQGQGWGPREPALPPAGKSHRRSWFAPGRGKRH